MKAKELRINNQIYFSTDDGKTKRIHIVVPKDIHVMNLCEVESLLAEGKSRESECYYPIPLTEEWLLKFGAILYPWGWVLKEFLIATNHKDKYWIEVGNGKRIKIPYVHTLQNFFALTGTELEIK